MAKNRHVTVTDGTVDPFGQSIGPGDNVHFDPDTDETVVDIAFDLASPVEWRHKKGEKGKTVKGKVNDCVKMDDRFPYTVGSSKSKLLAQPELIVDGGLLGKRARTKRTTRAKPAKRAKKRTKRAKR